MKPVQREEKYKDYLKYLTGTDDQLTPKAYKVNKLVESHQLSFEGQDKDYDPFLIAILLWSLLIVVVSFSFNGLLWPFYGFAILLFLVIFSRIDNQELYTKGLMQKTRASNAEEEAISTTLFNYRILHKKYIWLYILFTVASVLTMICGYFFFRPIFDWWAVLSAVVISALVWSFVWISKAREVSKKHQKFSSLVQEIVASFN